MIEDPEANTSGWGLPVQLKSSTDWVPRRFPTLLSFILNFVSRFGRLALLLAGSTAARTAAELKLEHAVISPDGPNRIATVVNGVSPGAVLTGTRWDKHISSCTE
ncbi:hypothetical protein BU15DRAFT_64281 [Melanogaster broomeanus]|nr:hypothetical protein BU15DRAFT_64281 [Melanogaster broomeanus]